MGGLKNRDMGEQGRSFSYTAQHSTAFFFNLFQGCLDLAGRTVAPKRSTYLAFSRSRSPGGGGGCSTTRAFLLSATVCRIMFIQTPNAFFPREPGVMYPTAKGAEHTYVRVRKDTNKFEVYTALCFGSFGLFKPHHTQAGVCSVRRTTDVRGTSSYLFEV